MSKFLIRRRDYNYRLGGIEAIHDWEPADEVLGKKTNTLAQLLKLLRKFYGKCKVQQHHVQVAGKWQQVGWVFVKKGFKCHCGAVHRPDMDYYVEVATEVIVKTPWDAKEKK